MARLSGFTLFLSVVFCFFLFFKPAAAFGAGNIVSVSKISGKNWRHGDIEDTLLELFLSRAGDLKFDKLAVKRVYFGNWLRDYSQAIDVGGLKFLPKESIRLLLWVLSFLTFGYATGEFEVTEERLGCYRPEEHIDNPKDYADNEDARVYDERLRGPVDEERELAIDPENGMKMYIASEHAGIDTSAGLVRKLLTDCIKRARKYGRDGNKEDLYEAMRLLGTALHCLEDYMSHSNYIELALRELGVEAYPHVGENTKVNVRGIDVYPIVTGTFGMTDFLHSVVGEVSDKMYQSEVQQLDSTIQQAHDNTEANSKLKEILDKIPFGLLGLGDSDFKGDADKLADKSHAKELETKATISDNNDGIGNNIQEFAQNAIKEIYPILEFHDKLMKAVAEGIDKIPFADTIMETLSGALTIYIFSLLAPFVQPILKKVKVELAAGSDGVLQTSAKAQYNVFSDPNDTNPTHSMLSKDHFTNVLNEPAGRIATEIVRFVVPLVTRAWDDDNIDIKETVDEVLQVLHHPALRERGNRGQEMMFEATRRWWEEQGSERQEFLRDALSKEGVREGRNHEGDDDSGAPGGRTHSHGGCSHSHSHSSGGRYGGSSGHGRSEQRSYGRQTEESQSHGGYGSRRNEGESYGSGTTYGSRRNEEESSYGGGYGSRRNEEESSYGGGYGSRRNEEESSYGGGYGSRRNEEESSYGGGYNSRRNQEESSYGGGSNYGSRRNEDESSYGGGASYGSRRNEEESSYGGGYGSRRNEDEPSYGSGYGSRRNEEESSYGSGYGSRRNEEESSYGGGYGSRRNEEESSYGGGYGSRNDDSYGGGYGRRRGDDEEEESGYRRRRDDNEDEGGYGSRRW